MNKKKLLIFGIPILFIGLAMALGVYFNSVKIDSNISEPLSSSSVSLDLSAYPGETKLETIDVRNAATVPLTVSLNWIEKSNIVLMDNSEGTCDNYPEPGWRDECEKRIVLEGMLLSDFESISWDANVIAGYAPHVDLKLSNGKSLTFEYATIDSDCNTPSTYPTGEINTFDDMGIVDDSAYAWESIPGACGDSAFDDQHLTLADWKIAYLGVTIDSIEVEVDNWISPSSSYLGNIKVNGDRIDSSLYGVLYSLGTENQVAQPGDNELEVSVIYATNSPVGELVGVIELSRE